MKSLIVTALLVSLVSGRAISDPRAVHVARHKGNSEAAGASAVDNAVNQPAAGQQAADQIAASNTNVNQCQKQGSRFPQPFLPFLNVMLFSSC